MIFRELKAAMAIWPTAIALVLAACTPASPAPASATVPPDAAPPTAAASTATSSAGVPPSPVTQTGECLEELVPPTITEVQPAAGAPGSEIVVIGSGGYIRDTCGGYNESARTFDLYLDNELAGELLCYVNRCEGKIALSSAIAPGSHCLSAQKDECEFEFQVAAP